MNSITPIHRARHDVLAQHEYKPSVNRFEACDTCGHGNPLSAHNVHCTRFHRAVRNNMVCMAFVSPVDAASTPGMPVIAPAWDADQDQLAAPMTPVQAKRAQAEQAADLGPKPSPLITLRERRAIVRTLAIAFVGLVLLMAYGLWNTARADDGAQLRVVVHQLSYHLDRSQHFRERNPGLGLQWRQRDALQNGLNAYVQAGVYLNSVDRRSLYLAAGAEPLSLAGGRLTLGAFAGVATGYRTSVRQSLYSYQQCSWPPELLLPECQTVTQPRSETLARGGVIPMGGLSASWHVTQRIALHLAATPDVKWRGNRNYAALGLMASMGF